MRAAGLQDYEISAWARPGGECVHNLNYWRFGDYIGIGAGAHGKITLTAEGHIVRTRRKAHPRPYVRGLVDGGFIAELKPVPEAEQAFEYFLNCLHMADPVPPAMFV